MALRTYLGRALAVLGAVIAGGGPASGQGTPPSSVPVTVYDGWLEPYTSYGRAEAGGAVIVFDQAPLLPGTGRPASAAPDPELAPPVETSAGPAPQTSPDAPAK